MFRQIVMQLKSIENSRNLFAHFFLLSLAFTVEVLLDNYCGCAILARNTEDLLIVIAYCLCHAFLSWFLAAGTAADDAEIGSIATVM